jgi:hypothetical protein
MENNLREVKLRTPPPQVACGREAWRIFRFFGILGDKVNNLRKPPAGFLWAGGMWDITLI